MEAATSRNEQQEDESPSLGESLEADTTGELAKEIMRRLREMKARLENEKRKLQHPKTYRSIMAGLNAIEGAESAIEMYATAKVLTSH